MGVLKVNNDYKEIENSEEFKKSMKENETTTCYKNEIANKILNASTIVTIVGFLIAIIGSYNLYSNHEGVLAIVIFFAIVVGVGLLSSILLKGLAEIIELLQSLNGKF